MPPTIARTTDARLCTGGQRRTSAVVTENRSSATDPAPQQNADTGRKPYGGTEYGACPTSRPLSRWAWTTLRVATSSRHIRRSTWPATTRRDGWQPSAACRHCYGARRRAAATASGFRWYARLFG